jgi:hypothetical protein
MASGEFNTSLAFIFTKKSALYSVVNILTDNYVGSIWGLTLSQQIGVKMWPS